MRRKGNHINILWVPASEDNKLLGLAKEQTKAATHEDAIPQAQVSRMKSTTLSLERSQAVTTKALPEDVGRHVKRVDAALPGKHTRQLYDGLSVERSDRAGSTPDRHGKIKWVSLPGQCRVDRPVCMRTSKSNRGAFPLPMPEVDHATDSTATSNGRRIWRQYEPQYDLQSPRVVSTPSNQVDQDNDTTP
ncbi:hypothetical protein CBS76997_10192 [Aspergillus niger]|nr:hypothetical protein CBS11852_10211 [Aspergillus niger]KAI2956424.1 hypothetical protein CBS147323_9259 [Aspergillus niger]KAI3036232.1 hypothetical protein CBS76997_10192 [Aspergillus niger]